MKKLICLILTAALLISMTSTTAFAGGHGRRNNSIGCGNQSTAPTAQFCTLDNCKLTAAHRHNGTRYDSRVCALYQNDYEICAEDGCEAVGVHEHDGEFYRCSSCNFKNGGCGSFKLRKHCR
ncbi:MAG: hypothetical protein FWH20_01705 [Oscillospiraceae bacterium]|nr:hypothetical protein [Oscillospiraceae bacterium]